MTELSYREKAYTNNKIQTRDISEQDLKNGPAVVLSALNLPVYKSPESYVTPQAPKAKARIPKLVILRKNPIVLGGLSSVSAKVKRLTAIDVFRGITILEVVTHHSSGMALRYLAPDTPAHEIVMIINRTLHFAVPAFVFLTSVILTKSLLAKFSPSRYFVRRLIRGAWPYVLWSALYIAWYVWTNQRPSESLLNWEQWQFYLLNGKASYHLYFLLVALEVYVLLPFLLPLARYRPSIGQMLFLGFSLQMGIFFINREYLNMPFPASTVFWYMLPILVGVAVGSRLGEFTEWYKKYRTPLLAGLLTIYPFYIFASQAYLRGIEISPFVFNGLAWLYSILVALLLFGAAHDFQHNTTPFWHNIKRFVARLGMVSLQIYLIHPAILQALERIYLPMDNPLQTLLVIVLYAVVALLLPAYIAWNLIGRFGSKLFFGR